MNEEQELDEPLEVQVDDVDEQQGDEPQGEPDDSEGKDFEFPGLSATYSPEDNKLRVTLGEYLSKPDFKKLKERLYAARFSWAPKQELFVCPRWTPDTEDLLLELCGYIGDEDKSTEDRAADRAERFSGYRDNRRDEAGDHADTFQSGPSAFGHQNLARAERQARRHDRHRTRALNQWSKAEYWQMRTQGVISHALHKTSPSVRRGRILTLEAEQRKQQSWADEYRKRFNTWTRVPEMNGADIPLGDQDVTQASPDAIKAAYILSGDAHYGSTYKHPRTGEVKDLYDLLRKGNDPLTPREAAALWLAAARHPDDPNSSKNRWLRHYDLRLEYEKAMAAEEGGMASEVEMEPGGWIGRRQIHGVVRSPATKRITSVKVLVHDHRWSQGDEDPRWVLRSVNIERLGTDAYRPPTDEERAEFEQSTKERKAKEKAERPKEPPTVNPTIAQATLLQAIWNSRARQKYEAKYPPGKYHGLKFEESEILLITQAQYSANSKGEYAAMEIRTIDGNAMPQRRSTNLYSSEGHKYDDLLAEPVCKLRLRSSHDWDSPPRVIVLTDKPQKEIPLDWNKVGAVKATVEE